MVKCPPLFLNMLLPLADLRAAQGKERRSGKAAPQKLTTHQRQVVERLRAAHGDDVGVRATSHHMPHLQIAQPNRGSFCSPGLSSSAYKFTRLTEAVGNCLHDCCSVSWVQKWCKCQVGVTEGS